jgi:hypothetical protein
MPWTTSSLTEAQMLAGKSGPVADGTPMNDGPARAADALLGQPVEVPGRHTGRHRRAQQLEGATDHEAGGPHAAYLVGSLDLHA